MIWPAQVPLWSLIPHAGRVKDTFTSEVSQQQEKFELRVSVLVGDSKLCAIQDESIILVWSRFDSLKNKKRFISAAKIERFG